MNDTSSLKFELCITSVYIITVIIKYIICSYRLELFRYIIEDNIYNCNIFKVQNMGHYGLLCQNIVLDLTHYFKIFKYLPKLSLVIRLHFSKKKMNVFYYVFTFDTENFTYLLINDFKLKSGILFFKKYSCV